MKTLHTLFLSAWFCIRASKAFVLSVKAPAMSSLHHSSSTLHVRNCGLRRRTSHGYTTVGVNSREEGSREMAMVVKGSPAPLLSEDELVAMDKARDEANRKVEEFLEKNKAAKEARRQEASAEQRNKIANRIKAEKEEAAHKKVYIPQRLEEIEREQASLEDRMSAFNNKIKDKEIKEL